MTVRVAHRPSRHPYVDRLHTDGVVTVEVPDVFDVGALAGRVEIVHVHFGFEHLDDVQLTRWAGELRRREIGLVVTAHDLDNPHLVDQRAHHRAVRALTTAADAVVSLTPWAAAELRRRTGVDSTVVPHPPVVPAAELRRRPVAPSRRGVYVHAATLRPNLDLELLEDVTRSAAQVGGVRVHVRAQHLAAAPQELRRRIEAMATADEVSVEVGDRLADEELWDRMASARAVLLPYRWGTQSGLLEAARDLGTACVAPAHGGYGDQGAATYDDAASCVRLLADPPQLAPRVAGASAEDVAVQHAELYRRVAARHERVYR